MAEADRNLPQKTAAVLSVSARHFKAGLSTFSADVQFCDEITIETKSNQTQVVETIDTLGIYRPEEFNSVRDAEIEARTLGDEFRTSETRTECGWDRTCFSR